MPKAAFSTLGCKVNQYETEVMQRQFEADGFEVVPDREPADVYVINSCTVTGEGDKKTKQLLRRLRRRSPGAVIALTGCFPQAFPEEAALIPEADVVTGARERAGVLDRVKQCLAARGHIVAVPPHEPGEPFEPMFADRFTEHTRAFVKIEDGCDRWCSYCIIPKARGPIRSKPLPELARELAALAANGYREAVLVGINLSSYGKESGALRLAEAVSLACAVPGIERVRLGSLEPELLTVEDVNVLAELENFCPQFHLSLQSGCAATLRRMNRHYDPIDYERIVSLLRERFWDRPGGASITTDIMVGFPGEDEDEFEESLAFVRRIGFARAHVFAYSPRAGTRAAEMENQVPPRVKEERSRRMLEAAAEARRGFMETQRGTVQDVLFETRRADGKYIGHTKNYTPVAAGSQADPRGKIVPVELGGYDEKADSCEGRI